MRRVRLRSWFLAIAWLVVSVVTAAYAFGSSPEGRTGGRVLGPGNVTVTLQVEHSRFEPARLVVRQHSTVTFRIVNHDPIGHELIVGGDDVHARHEAGTHGQHGAVPGEVSVAPGETATTTYEFHTPGVVVYACHLPGHFAYGMAGEVVVRPARQPSSSTAK
jgi:uncharacterized cupredoxin-like copper-binding protein